MKIDSSSGSDRRSVPNHTDAGIAADRNTAPHDPAVMLDHVSLRFRVYDDKSLSLKRAAVGWALRRLRALSPWREPQHAAPQCTAPNAISGGTVSLDGRRRGADFWALRNINLAIDAGHRVGIVGPNGAGKTTLLKLMARIYQPTRGRVTVHGRVAPLMDLGGAFNGELSARENILLHGALLGFDRRTMLRRMQAILEFADVTEFANLQVKYFSSGMTARLGFSIATDVEPEVLLVDEVFATGDANFREKATARMRTLMGRSGTVVMTSHDLKLVADLCNRVLLLQQGRIVADGPPKAVLRRYERHIRARSAQTLPPERRRSGIEVQIAHRLPESLHPHALSDRPAQLGSPPCEGGTTGGEGDNAFSREPI